MDHEGTIIERVARAWSGSTRRRPSGPSVPARVRIAGIAAALGLAYAGASVHAKAADGGSSARIDVRIASQASMPPKWVHLRNEVAGLCPDMLAAIERTEPRLRFTGFRQPRSLPAIEAGLDGGGLDVACGLVASAHRRSLAEPVGPAVYVVRHRLIARRDDPADVRSIDDLVRLDALVVGPRGTVFAARLRAAGVRVDDATDDNAVNLRKIVAGHGRFLDMNDLTLRHYLRRDDFGGQVRVLPDVVAEEPAYFWVSRKADADIVRLLGRALVRLKASGELDRIYRRRAATP